MTTAAPTAVARATHHARDRVFYSGMAVVIATIVFAGFSPSFYLASHFDRPVPSPLRVVHGTMFTAWIVLFLVQTALITTRRADVHRRLGIAGAGLAAGMVVMGTVLAIVAALEGHAPPGLDPRAFLAVPLFDMAVFAPLVAAAVYFRRRPQTHKRLMLLATVTLVGAAAGRLALVLAPGGPPVVFAFAVVDLLLLAGVLYDVATRRPVHPAYIWGGLLILASEPLRLVVGRSHAWLVIANVLVGR